MSSTIRPLAAFAAAALISSSSRFAAAQTPPTTGTSGMGQTVNVATPAHTSRASLSLYAGRSKAWTGQSIPVTLRAYFRDVDGVTMEGAPQLSAAGFFTSDLSPEPRQETEIIDGEPTLVATWTGTLTPSAAGPIHLSATLPIEIRYSVESTQVAPGNPFMGDDVFARLMANPFDMSVVNRVFSQTLSTPHSQAIELRASAKPIAVSDPPTVGQPASFGGAVGHFRLHASVSAGQVHTSEPLTLRVSVTGDGDLDRVELPGVSNTEDWKAYPPTATIEPSGQGKGPRRKVFEQVLVPLRPGNLTVPPISLVAFDPVTAAYVTHSTDGLTVSVDGAPVAVTSMPAPSAAPATPSPPPTPSGRSTIAPYAVNPRYIAGAIVPVGLLFGVIALVRALSRGRTERQLRRAMRRAAARGHATGFVETARKLVEVHLARLWDISPRDVTPEVIRGRLGSAGETLAAVLAIDATLRFGRAQLEQTELRESCRSIEVALRGVS